MEREEYNTENKVQQLVNLFENKKIVENNKKFKKNIKIAASETEVERVKQWLQSWAQ